MSLHVDSSAASQYIDCGSAAAIDDWTACSIVAWCRATSLATLDDIRRIGAKTSTIPLGKELQHAYHSSGIAQDCLRFRVNRATAVANAESVANTVVANEWMFAAGVYDEASGPQIYKGTLTALVAEVAYSSGPTVGSGATSSDADGPLRWGQRPIAGANAASGFRGDISFGLYVNRRLTLAELQALQYRLLFYRFTEAKAAYQFGLHAGIGSQPDISGNGNTGTIVGSVTLADHVPLGPPFGFWNDVAYRVAVVGTPWYAYAQQ